MKYYINENVIVVKNKDYFFAYDRFLHKKFLINEAVFNILKFVYMHYGATKETLARKFGLTNASFGVLLAKNFLKDEKQKRFNNIKEPKTSFARVFIELTNKCNLKCKHCYGDFGNLNNNSLNVDNVIKLIKKASKLGFYECDFTGGEPFLYKDFEKILDITFKEGMLVTIFSNLTILNDKMLATLKSKGVKKIITSIESKDEDLHNNFRGLKGALRQTENNLNKIINIGIEHHINIVAGRHNYNDVLETIRYYHNKNYNIAFDFVSEEGRANKEEILSDDEYKYLAKEIREQKLLDLSKKAPFCGVGQRMVFINSLGNFCLCPNLIEKEFVFGNINYKYNLKNILNEIYSKYGNLYCNENCDKKEICNGGCRARAFKQNGSLYAGHNQYCLFYGKGENYET